MKKCFLNMMALVILSCVPQVLAVEPGIVINEDNSHFYTTRAQRFR